MGSTNRRRPVYAAVLEHRLITVGGGSLASLARTSSMALGLRFLMRSDALQMGATYLRRNPIDALFRGRRFKTLTESTCNDCL